MKILIFSAHDFEKESMESANTDNHELVFLNVELDKKTARLVKEADAISIFVNDDASKETLDVLSEKGVKIILLRSAGYNRVDLKHAAKLGLKVAYVPEYSPYAVAEHTVALMMALNRNIIKAHNRVRDLNFSLNGLTGFDFNGKTVGIAGFGKIGQKVANIMFAMGCEVLAFDQIESQEYIDKGVRYVSFKELCQKSHVISLHLPLNSHTRYIVNEQSIDWMKDDVMLINTGRGGLIDTRSAIDALKSSKIGYLGLDVYEEEQNLFFEDHSNDILQDDHIARLLTFSNVLITSHQAFLTKTALRNIAETTFHNLHCFESGESCGNFI